MTEPIETDDPPISAQQPKAFISHHSSQVETARRLKSLLIENGIDGWMAPDDVPPGTSFDRAILEQVRQSDLVILLFCEKSDQSRHVKRELMLADNEGKLIYPVRLEKVSSDGLAYWLTDNQWVDWSGQDSSPIKRMIGTIHAQHGSVPAEQTAPHETASSLTKREVHKADKALKKEAKGEKDEKYKLIRLAIIMAGVIGIVTVTSPNFWSNFSGGRDDQQEDTVSAASESNEGRLSDSVNCDDPANDAHRIICNNSQLAGSERRNAAAYDIALASAGSEQRGALQESQRIFIDRRDSCTNNTCLSGVYATRTLELLSAAQTPGE